MARDAAWLRSRAVPDGFHPPLEEYLRAIYELEEEGVDVIRARLAERLHHTPAAVTEMVRRLVTEGDLQVEGRAIRMTAEGKRRARSVVRRHRLAERLLTDVIGLPWSRAHVEAGRWEHVISEEVEQRLVALLDDPATCPHGNPIPGSHAERRPVRSLAAAVTGERVVLERVSETVEEDLDTLCYLDAHGFRPGAAATVTGRAPDGTLTLEVEIEGKGETGHDTIAVGAGLAAQLDIAAG